MSVVQEKKKKEFSLSHVAFTQRCVRAQEQPGSLRANSQDNLLENYQKKIETSLYLLLWVYYYYGKLFLICRNVVFY